MLQLLDGIDRKNGCSCEVVGNCFLGPRESMSSIAMARKRKLKIIIGIEVTDKCLWHLLYYDELLTWILFVERLHQNLL